MAAAYLTFVMLQNYRTVRTELSIFTAVTVREKGGKPAFCFLSTLLQFSELFEQVVSLWPLAASSLNKPNSPMTFSQAPPPSRSPRACTHPIAGRDRSPPSAPRSARPPFAAPTPRPPDSTPVP